MSNKLFIFWIVVIGIDIFLVIQILTGHFADYIWLFGLKWLATVYVLFKK